MYEAKTGRMYQKIQTYFVFYYSISYIRPIILQEMEDNC